MESVCSIPIDEYLLTRIAFTPDGHHILIGHRNPALFDILSGRPVRTFPFEAFLAPVIFSPCGSYMALVNESDNHPRTPGLVRVFSPGSGDLLFEAKTDFPVSSCCFCRQGDETIFLYRDALRAGEGRRREIVRGCRIPSGKQAIELDFSGWEIRAMACGAGRLMVFGFDSHPETRRIEGASLQYRRFKSAAFLLPEGRIEHACDFGIGAGLARFSPAGRSLVAELAGFRENRRHLCVLDCPNCAIRSLAGIPDNVIPALAFSEDERYLLCLTEDREAGGILQLWETETLALAGQTQFGQQYHALAIHNGTSRIAALGGGRCDIGLYQVDSE